MPEHPTTIIIVKKKVHHDGHHGGAWKVAYADFVTAMMALFIVLWLLSADEKVKKAVGGYFQDPSGAGKLSGSTLAGVGEALPIQRDDMAQLKEKLEAALKQMTSFERIKNHIQITITAEGLRIELMEDDAGMFFESAKVSPSDTGQRLLITLAEELGKLPNQIYLEGHTDSKPFGGQGSYSNWELSADRANSARRIMQQNGIRENQVAQVRGFADQYLRYKEDSLNPNNRRVSIIVRYMDAVPAGKKAQVSPPQAPPAVNSNTRANLSH